MDPALTDQPAQDSPYQALAAHPPNMHQPAEDRGGSPSRILEDAPIDIEGTPDFFARLTEVDLRRAWVPVILHGVERHLAIGNPHQEDIFGDLARSLMVVSRRLYRTQFTQEITMAHPLRVSPQVAHRPVSAPIQPQVHQPTPQATVQAAGQGWELVQDGPPLIKVRGPRVDPALLQALIKLPPLPARLRLTDGKKFTSTFANSIIKAAISCGAPSDLTHLKTADGARVIYRKAPEVDTGRKVSQ